MKYYLLGFILLALFTSCSALNDETLTYENNNSEEDLATVDDLPLEFCEGREVNCIRQRHELDEYNYCEVDSDCVIAEYPDCDCRTPDTPGKAVNVRELDNYDSYVKGYCEEKENIDCPQYSPPLKYSVYEAKCLSNVCSVVRAGWR